MGKFRGSAQNSVFRGKLWSLITSPIRMLNLVSTFLSALYYAIAMTIKPSQCLHISLPFPLLQQLFRTLMRKITFLCPGTQDAMWNLLLSNLKDINISHEQFRMP